MTQDLEIFAPAPRRVTVGGRHVDLLPLRLRQYAGFLRAIEPALPLVLAGDLMAAAVDHEAAMLRAVSIGSGLPEAELAELWADEFILLARAVVEVNADFFVARVRPQIEAARAAMAALVSSAGASSSPGSDDAATH